MSAPDGVHGYEDGFWRNEHGDIWLRWYDGTSAGCKIQVDSEAGAGDRLNITVTTGVVRTSDVG